MFNFCQYFLFGFSKKTVCEQGAKCRQYFLKRESESFFILAVFGFFYILGCTDVLLKQGCIKHCDIVFSINSWEWLYCVHVHSYL